MNCRLLVLLLILFGAGRATGQDADTLPVGAVRERSITASRSAEAFRSPGEYRVWRYFGDQTTLGQLTSVVKGFTEIGGQSALVVEETMRLDYAPMGGDREIITEGTSYVSNSGRYVGSDLRVGDSAGTEQLKLTCLGGSIEGYFTRAGTEQSIAMAQNCDRYFWDLHLVDQIEFYLAMQDIQIGTLLDDSIFQPQSLMSARIAGQVTHFMHKEIYKDKFDSVFVIRLTEPNDYQLYLTPDKRLVRVDLVHQDIRVYQDLVGTSSTLASEQAKPKVGSLNLLLKLPHYGAFVIVAGLMTLFFSAAAFRWSLAYLFLAGGVLLYGVIPAAINPLLVAIVENWLSPSLAAGGSLYLMGVVPALTLALAQVGLLLAGIVGLFMWRRPKDYRLIGLGAFLGAGFALAEACWMSGLQIAILFDWPLAERAGFIILQVTTGGLLGWIVAHRHRWTVVLVPVLVSAAVRYLPLLIQGGLADVETVHFVMVVGMVLYLLAAMMILKSAAGRGATEAGSD